MITRTKMMLLAGMVPAMFLTTLGTAHAQVGTNIETVPIWRVQLKIQTADVTNAGTDDNVYVQLRTSGTKLYIDYGGDDFERNKTKTYDIVFAAGSIGTVADIQQLTLGKEGTDGWAVKSVQLFINGASSPLFSHSFSTPKWIDGDDGYLPTFTFSSTTLRANASWTWPHYGQLLGAGITNISRASLESMIEGIVGHKFTTPTAIYWGNFSAPRWVELATKVSDTTWHTAHVDLDLAKSLNNAPDANVDVDFDLVVSCGPNQLVPDRGVTYQFRVDINSTVVTASVLGIDVTSLIEQQFDDQRLVDATVSQCPFIAFNNDGDLSILW